MALSRDPDTLPCGVELETLVAQVTDDAPAPDPSHQAACAYCQAALRGLHLAWGDVRLLAQTPVPIPTGLTARIMRRVRDLARRAADHLVLAGTRGHTEISHAVIAQIARRAALTVPGVLFASAQPAPGQTGDPGRLTVTVRLVTTYGPALNAIAAGVRATLRRRLAALAGAEIDRIDITVVDIDTPESQRPSAPGTGSRP